MKTRSRLASAVSGALYAVRAHTRFSVHNLLGHPAMELLHLFGLNRAARWIHRRTLPKDLRDAGGLRLEVEAGEYFKTKDGETVEWMNTKELQMMEKMATGWRTGRRK